MPSPDHKLTLEEMEQRLSKLKAPSDTPVADDVEPLRWSYRMAACVLSRFEPTTLRPYGTDSTPGGAMRHLMEDCEIVTLPGGETRWTLRQGARQAAIARLGSRRELRRALALNPSPEPDLLQRMISGCLTGSARPVEEQELEELICTLQVVHWFRPVLPELPDPQQVRRRLERLQLLAPFRYLAGQHFCGRGSELQDLRDYVGVVDVSVSETVMQTFRGVFFGTSREPLLVHGPGGMGKSTLLARFILDHADSRARVPFAYLDFDDPALTLDNPVSLIAEITRQFHLQYPEEEELSRLHRICQAALSPGRLPTLAFPEAELKRTAESLSLLLGHLEGALKVPSISEPDATVMLSSRLLNILTHALGTTVATVLQRRSLRVARGLLVLDTFEEVQFRGVGQVETVARFLALLQVICPELRTVICGRAPVEHLKVEQLALTELAPEAARELLRLSGVPDEAVAGDLVEQLGGNPLTLKLAAEVVRYEGLGRGGIPGLKKRRFFFFSTSEAVIQGLLYGRILGHIHDPRVRKLAHPGLVVRRITPEIIEKVLAGPCGLQLEGPGDVEALFQEFRREVSLVSAAPDQSLHHRSDIRRVMLELLKAEKPAQIREIHQAAVALYRERLDPISRAEEIYHRLALGESPREVEERWMPGVEPYLRNALEELPPSARPFLAARLGLELSPRMRAQADLADWERNAEARARALLSHEDAVGALQMLGERKERTRGSPLYLVEAQALARLGNIEDALDVLEQGLTPAMWVTGASSVPLLLLHAEMAAELERFDLADESLEGAAQIARRVERADLVLQALVERARLATGDPKEWRERADALRAFLAGTSDAVLRRHVELARGAFGLVAGGQPDLLARGLEVVGFGDARSQVPEVRDVLELLLRTGWPAARSAFESGEVDQFLLGVLHKGGFAPEFVPWVNRALAARGLPPRASWSVPRKPHWTETADVVWDDSDTGVPGWIAQAFEPWRPKLEESPSIRLALRGESTKGEALRTVTETLNRLGDADAQKLPLLFFRAELADNMGGTEVAEATLLHAAQIARRYGQFGRELQALTRRAQLHAEAPEQWLNRRGLLGGLLDENPDDVIYRHSRLARLAIGLVAEAHPGRLIRGLSTVRLGLDFAYLSRTAEDVLRMLRHTGWFSRARGNWYDTSKAERLLIDVLQSADCPPDLPALVSLMFMERGSLELDQPSPPSPTDLSR